MEIYINDLSFKGQFKDESEVIECITNISKIISKSKKFNGNSPIQRTRMLKNRPISKDMTINDFFSKIISSSDPQKSSLVTLFLTLMQGPFIDSTLFNDDHENIQSICGEVVKLTSLHADLSKKNKSINAVISAPKLQYDNFPHFSLEIESDRKIVILNLLSESCCDTMSRIYEPNPKHEIRKDKVVDGEKITKMDLDSSVAQQCLENGIQILGERFVYAFYNGRWYEFPSHQDGHYHGYPIEDKASNPTLNKIKRVFGMPPYNDVGYQFLL
ncbi:hypothetical protein [Acinetobacter guillouiae]|uniref:hypothetical protein n=1 Tax=Acinetobacter guillouiae TaxID=106649 RepID=UPI001AEA03AC|nr:hypothetical protein [Acinetobacter guillouiae]MBP2543187.1 hypothetical protein [Acinetobacter guillouiae]